MAGANIRQAPGARHWPGPCPASARCSRAGSATTRPPSLSARWHHPGGASAGFTLRYVGGYQECAANDCNLAANRATAHDVDRYDQLDLFGGYDWRTGLGLTSLQVGIDNALDATPPAVYDAAAANSDASTYDFVGRMFYLRLAHQY